MKPVTFDYMTKNLKAPPGREADIADLPVSYVQDLNSCVSCWELSFVERLKVLLWGRVWLYVMSGSTQPPVALEATNNPFTADSEILGAIADRASQDWQRWERTN